MLRLICCLCQNLRRRGHGWGKAGVLLLDLAAPGAAPASLFEAVEKSDERLMRAIDPINARYGRGASRLGLAHKNAKWHTRRASLSPSFTTRWGDIPAAKMSTPAPKLDHDHVLKNVY